MNRFYKNKAFVVHVPAHNKKSNFSNLTTDVSSPYLTVLQGELAQLKTDLKTAQDAVKYHQANYTANYNNTSNPLYFGPNGENTLIETGRKNDAQKTVDDITNNLIPAKAGEISTETGKLIDQQIALLQAKALTDPAAQAQLLALQTQKNNLTATTSSNTKMIIIAISVVIGLLGLGFIFYKIRKGKKAAAVNS